MDLKHKCKTSDYKTNRRLHWGKIFINLVGTDFLDKIQKTLTIKGKQDILDFCSSNHTINKKRWPAAPRRRKYLKYFYLTKDILVPRIHNLE